MLKLGTTMKHKLITALLLLGSILMTGVIYMDTVNTRQTCSVPVVKRDLPVGSRIGESDLVKVEVGKYNLDKLGLILIPADVVGQFAAIPLKKGHPLRRGDVLKKKPATSLKEQLNAGAVTISTDFERCVGGVPMAGDWVKVKIILKEGGIVSVVEPPSLERIKVLSVQDKSGKPFDGKGEGMGSEPELITFDLDRNQQNELLKGQYLGKVHLVLLPQKTNE